MIICINWLQRPTGNLILAMPDCLKLAIIVNQKNLSLFKETALKLKLPIILIIVVCTLVVISQWPALSTKARLFDDDQYFTMNSLVQNPSWKSAKRFFTEVLEPSTVGGYYQPVTMVSLMLDCSMGATADNLRPFRRTSLTLHVANTALVIILLYLLFGHIWVASCVGLLFGLHPMTIEPICWLSDRKTLLATFFMLWSLILYVRSTKKGDWKLYTGCIILYMLSVLSKPTSLPLPALMLLLDYWPLGRLKMRAVLEKIPLAVAGGAFAVITYISQSRTAVAVLPDTEHLSNVAYIICHNIFFYPYKIIWPVNLSTFYGTTDTLQFSTPMVRVGVIGTCILIPLLLISLRWTRSLLTGWLFFFVALLPTLGLIGFTIVIASDKYAYLPSLGLLLILASFLRWFCSTSISRKNTIRCAIMVILVLVLGGFEAIASRRYFVHWRDTETLFKHMLTLTPKRVPLHNNLGVELTRIGKYDEAIKHIETAIELQPDFHQAYTSLGLALIAQNKLEQALVQFDKTLELNPNYIDALRGRGKVFIFQGKYNEAVVEYKKLTQMQPDNSDSFRDLGVGLILSGRGAEAIEYLERAVDLDPDSATMRFLLARAFIGLKQYDKAIDVAEKALILSRTAGDEQLTQRIKQTIAGLKETIKKPDFSLGE